MKPGKRLREVLAGATVIEPLVAKEGVQDVGVGDQRLSQIPTRPKHGRRVMRDEGMFFEKFDDVRRTLDH